MEEESGHLLALLKEAKRISKAPKESTMWTNDELKYNYNKSCSVIVPRDKWPPEIIAANPSVRSKWANV